ncbi:hypothetical protein EBE87_22015 [Pseudoroseomonas wenyumeiae]|uniref:Uncharacterized protein n=1 Tax=Teichococcus wenyumeiae TaxID=2478470 RepID=A0A3A9JD20_9PROT|nr:hypothetical protein D6Z83_05590 [Pseudoroseomonas wenyumeiae]RMI17602.1 hypothetical protein EBE87_22015 [Pseudoroseomonas wenyumeiae]
MRLSQRQGGGAGAGTARQAGGCPGCAADPALVICARTDALGVEGMTAALDRAALYREAGADMVFVQGADDAETLRKVCASVPGPHLANVSQASGRPGLSAAEC